MMARPASGMWSKPSTANASIRVLLPEPGPPVMTWKSGRSAIARTFRFRVARALAPPLPERQHIASVVALNARCTIEQRRPEERRDGKEGVRPGRYRWTAAH